MKRVFIIITLALVSFLCKAQDKQPPSMEEHLKRSQEMMQKELQMNSGQQHKVEQAFKDFMAGAEKIHKENPPPPPPPMDPKVKEALDKLAAERDAKIKLVLTEDQYKKYVAMEKKMRPPHPGGMHKDQPPSYQ